MSDRLKSFALFAAIAGFWFLLPQVGLADTTNGDFLNVPEPTSMSLLAGGVAAALYAAWRRRK